MLSVFAPIGRRSFVVLCTAMLLVLTVACAKRARPPSTSLGVAAAASLRDVLPEVVREFEASSAGVHVEVVYGSSGSLATQVAQRAPYDVFLSADTTFPAQLEKDGHAIAGSTVRYAAGRIALWVPTASPLDLDKGMECLRDQRVRRIAIANPRLAPYGVAARQALDRIGLSGTNGPQVVEAENIAQAAQYVESGATDIGILALSTVMSETMKAKGRSWTIPADMHEPIIHAGCVIASTPDRAAAERFLAFLRSETGRAIVQRHGFDTPADP
jgi:molybdate transport system substrate-binding protein